MAAIYKGRARENDGGDNPYAQPDYVISILMLNTNLAKYSPWQKSYANEETSYKFRLIKGLW